MKLIINGPKYNEEERALILIELPLSEQNALPLSHYFLQFAIYFLIQFPTLHIASKGSKLFLDLYFNCSVIAIGVPCIVLLL